VEIDPRKKNPFDFVLWKSSKPDEPAWPSPWGEGRPGWHIECSAMSSRYLGETFDIHGGGKDLIFPHHENEIAQSEAAHGKKFARYWIHNGFVNIDHEKMSKSLGNFLMIKDVIQLHHPEAVRLFLLSKHYRKPIDYNQATVLESSMALDRVYTFLARAAEILGPPKDSGTGGRNGKYWQQFCKAMNDDFNTASGIGTIFEAVRYANRMIDESQGKDAPVPAALLDDIRWQISKIGDVLGIFQEDANAYLSGKKAFAAEKMAIDTEQVNQLIAARTAARQNKDWKKADQIRQQLAEMHIVLEDRPDGTVWKVDGE
jgi:cysteinyl-tRNA synthetase